MKMRVILALAMSIGIAACAQQQAAQQAPAAEQKEALAGAMEALLYGLFAMQRSGDHGAAARGDEDLETAPDAPADAP